MSYTELLPETVRKVFMAPKSTRKVSLTGGCYLPNALIARRIYLCRKPPRCPSCGERHQVQLVSWSTWTIGKWKCRNCKTDFGYEPITVVVQEGSE